MGMGQQIIFLPGSTRKSLLYEVTTCIQTLAKQDTVKSSRVYYCATDLFLSSSSSLSSLKVGWGEGQGVGGKGWW